MRDAYTYQAKISETAEGFDIEFPDFDVITCCEEKADVMKNAQELLAITVMDYEKSGKVLPEATEIENGVSVTAWIPYFEKITKEVNE